MLNREELLVGGVFGSLFVFRLGWFVIPIIIATSLLWAIGGSYRKIYRRLGCSLVPILACFLVAKKAYILISFPLLFAVLSIGYGIPSEYPQDEGSLIGRIAFRISGRNFEMANLITRGIIYLLIIIASIPCLI